MTICLLEWGLKDELAKLATRVRASTFYSSKCPRQPLVVLSGTHACFVVETGEAIGSLEWKEDVIQETGADFLLMAVRSLRISHVADI